MNLECAAPALPAMLALLSAFMFAVGIQLTRLGLQHTDPATAALVQIAASTGAYWLLAPAFVEARYWLTPAVLLFAAIGLFRPFLSARLALAGTKHLGPTISSTLSGTAPLFGVTFGVLALSESLTLPVVTGTLGIMAGVIVLSSKGKATKRDWAVWALLLPVGASLLRALAQLLAKVGMESLPSPFFVGLVGYTVSLAIALVGTDTRRRASAFVHTPGFKWLLLTGVVNGLSVLSLNTALACGKLSVISPIVACSPFFTLLLGWFVFKETTINARVVTAVALIVPSVVFIIVMG